MAFAHHVLTLTGVAQRLSDVFGVAADSTDFARLDVPLRAFSLQPLGTNANPIYVGGSAAVAAAAFGVRLEPGVATIPPAPFILGEFETGPLKLSQVWVIGTAAEKLMIATVPF